MGSSEEIKSPNILFLKVIMVCGLIFCLLIIGINFFIGPVTFESFIEAGSTGFVFGILLGLPAAFILSTRQSHKNSEIMEKELNKRRKAKAKQDVE